MVADDLTKLFVRSGKHRVPGSVVQEAYKKGAEVWIQYAPYQYVENVDPAYFIHSTLTASWDYDELKENTGVVLIHI